MSASLLNSNGRFLIYIYIDILSACMIPKTLVLVGSYKKDLQSLLGEVVDVFGYDLGNRPLEPK